MFITKDLTVPFSFYLQKKWVDKSDHNCFMLFARSLYITWVVTRTGDENVEVAKLSHVCWLDVKGKFSISELSPGIAYEIVYEVKLTNGASGWELPITLKLSLPNGEVRERQVVILEKPRKKWIELNVGNFLTKQGETGEVCFDIIEHGGHWKKGLFIKGAIIRPKMITTQ
ncbi:hypothetical protein GH714_021391 [Hevea brasiliensis]|uniref:Phloem protein 2 n=1 Tax=Hevea brasiliensis TaxID=3981 RepID=A0A6A6M2E2_HEVBR|nr:hypothetical protein GH714_021391 [Hevea brasiliensis]